MKYEGLSIWDTVMVIQAERDARKELLQDISLEIDKMRRISIERHEYIDTCSIYRMLQGQLRKQGR